MAFTVVHPDQSQTLWAPVEPSEVVYTGSIIGLDTATPLSGVQPMPVAAGAANVTNLDVPLGVVVGNSNVSGNLAFSTTYKTEYITAVAEGSIYGSTTNYTGTEGVWAKGDKIAMVEYIPITAETVLRGPLYNAAYGTAPTVGTVSVASSSGLDCTSSAVDVAPVANFTTLYVRTGAARGSYRIVTTTSTTAHEFTPDLVADIAVGDEILVINRMRPFGMSKAYIDDEGMYFDINAALTSNYLMIDVVRLDLSEAGNEYVEFRFSPVNFQHTVRINTTA